MTASWSAAFESALSLATIRLRSSRRVSKSTEAPAEEANDRGKESSSALSLAVAAASSAEADDSTELTSFRIAATSNASLSLRSCVNAVCCFADDCSKMSNLAESSAFSALMLETISVNDLSASDEMPAPPEEEAELANAAALSSSSRFSVATRSPSLAS